MAESKPIQDKDIFSPNIWDNAIKGAEATLKAVNDLQAGLEGIYKTTKSGADRNKLLDSKDIKDYTKSLNELNAVQKLAEQTKKAEIKAEKDLLDTKIKAEKLRQQEIKTAQFLNKENDKALKTQQNLNSEYKQATQALNKLEKRLLDNNVAGRKTSATARLLAEEHEKMRAKIDAAEQSAGRFQRNVGNYSQQLRQLQREMQGLEPGSKAFNDLAIKAGKLKDAIGDAKDATKAFATESKFTTAKTLFGQIGRDLADLNFADAADKAKQFASVIKSMTFSEAAAGIKSLGSAILDVGKSLLFNPFTLIVAGITAVAYVLYDFGKAMYDAQFNTKVFNDALANQNKELKKYADRVKETQISIKETLGIYTAFQAKQKRKEIKDSEEILDIRKKHIEKVFALAEELELDISEMKNNRFKETYTGDYKELQRKKKFNAEISALESIRDREISDARATQRLENQQAEIEDNIKRADKAKEQYKKLREDIDKINDEADRERERKLKEKDDRIIKEMEDLEERKLKAKKILEDYNEGKLNETITEETWWDKENGITLEQHNIDVDNIEKTKKKAEDDRKAEAEKKKQQLKEEFDTTVDFAQQALNRKKDLREKELDNDLEMRQRNIQQQQDLAARGLNNTLAFEKAAAAKDELEKQKLAIKQEKREKAVAFLKLFSSYAEKGDPDQALAKSLIQMAIAEAVSGKFIEGTENVGEDLKGNKVHNGKDGYVIAVDGDERILNPKQNKMIGNLTNDQLAKLAMMHNNGQLLPNYIMNIGNTSVAENMNNSLLLHQVVSLNKEIKDIKQVLKERPTTSVNIDNLGNVINTKIVNGLKKQTVHKNNSSLNYI